MAKDKTDAEGAEGKVKVVAKAAMWRGGVKWDAGINEVGPGVLTDKVRKALESDPNFTIL